MADEFFQITVDVMSVRRPLLSTFALKRQRITIVFNHDYDRIIFWNETICRIFVIPTCMSDLLMGFHIEKALVMNGENVSNDVDEEVYAGDGA